MWRAVVRVSGSPWKLATPAHWLRQSQSQEAGQRSARLSNPVVIWRSSISLSGLTPPHRAPIRAGNRLKFSAAARGAHAR
jgi:hypothetical protein